MRMMSFSLTTRQILDQSKTVTRRTGWAFLKPGDLLQPVKKAQGLKKGEHPERIGGPIRVVSVRRETLSKITATDVVAEGFTGQTREWFIRMFCSTHRLIVGGHRTRAYSLPLRPFDDVTRIEFEYTEARG